MRLFQWNDQSVYVGIIFDIENDAAALPVRSTQQEPPEAPEGQEAYWTGIVWVLRDIAPEPAPTVDWPALIAARRYAAETAGIEFAGMRVETDDRSKLLINGAALEAMLDTGYVMQWKTPAGFVELGGAQVLAVARAVRAHVQTCFDREAELLDALEAGTFAPDMLDQGWPA